jgi:hypothetical protein
MINPLNGIPPDQEASRVEIRDPISSARRRRTTAAACAAISRTGVKLTIGCMLVGTVLAVLGPHIPLTVAGISIGIGMIACAPVFACCGCCSAIGARECLARNEQRELAPLIQNQP